MRNDLDLWRSRELWNPFRDFGTLPRRMDRLFNEFFGAFPSVSAESAESGFVPNCDVDELDHAFVFSFDVPGVKQDDLHVELSGNTLTVSGERSEQREEGKGRRRYWERYRGKFVRSFTLPDGVDAENARADYRDGVLRIELPKSAAAERRRIPIGESPPKFGAKSASSRSADKGAAGAGA
jgi:HSP20 family protein